MMLPPKPEKTPDRSIAVTRIYLDRGGIAARSLWVTIRPRNPLLKLALAPFIIALMVALLILMLVVLGFILLAVALMRAISLARHRNSTHFRL